MAAISGVGLAWDKTGEHFYQTGVDGVALFVMNTSGVYGAGVAWSGVTAINESPSGADSNKMYADNIEYLNLKSAEEFSFTIEAYQVPKEFDVCDGCPELPSGTATDAGDYSGLPAGAVKGHGNERRTFGLVYRVEKGTETNPAGSTDADYVYHIIYGATAQPSGADHATVNDSPDAVTFSYECDTIPISDATKLPSTWKKCSHLEIDASKLTATQVAELKEQLYGTVSGSTLTPPSTLPDPKTLLTAIAAA